MYGWCGAHNAGVQGSGRNINMNLTNTSELDHLNLAQEKGNTAEHEWNKTVKPALK